MSEISAEPSPVPGAMIAPAPKVCGWAIAALLLIYAIEAVSISSSTRFAALHLNLWLLDSVGLALAALIALTSATVWARAAVAAQVVAMVSLAFPSSHAAMAFATWAAAHLPAAAALVPGLVVRLDTWRRRGFRSLRSATGV